MHLRPTLIRGAGTDPRRTDVLPVVAQALGTSRQEAERALRGPLSLPRQCARVIAALKAAGAEEALVQFIQPIDLAIHEAQPAAVADRDERGLWGEDEERAGVAPTRELAQGYLNRLYQRIQLGTVR